MDRIGARAGTREGGREEMCAVGAKRCAVLKGSAAAASLGEDEVAALGDHLPALGGELIEESHRFPYVYVGLFGAVVAFVAFYIGRRTRNDAYYSV
jgi:hypothetical protein